MMYYYYYSDDKFPYFEFFRVKMLIFLEILGRVFPSFFICKEQILFIYDHWLNDNILVK